MLSEIGGEKDDSPDAIGTTGWFLEKKEVKVLLSKTSQSNLDIYINTEVIEADEKTGEYLHNLGE